MDRANGAEGKAASASNDGVIQIVFRFVEEIIASTDGLIEVYADRIRLSLRRKLVRAALGTAFGVCTVVWLAAAALAVFQGVCGGFTTLWGGRAWLGDLTGGLLALTLAASVIALCLRLSSRRELGRLKSKYERIRNANSDKHDSAAPADDGG